jgi:hypothetical protein
MATFAFEKRLFSKIKIISRIRKTKKSKHLGIITDEKKNKIGEKYFN